MSSSPTPPFDENFHLSLNAIIGTPSSRTLHFAALILGHIVFVLVDTGSSQNILQSRLASFFNLIMVSLTPFSVMVGNTGYL